jgi:hypothetical protein
MSRHALRIEIRLSDCFLWLGDWVTGWGSIDEGPGGL